MPPVPKPVHKPVHKPAHKVDFKINKKLDVIERTAWTFINTLLGFLTADEVLSGINVSLLHKLEVAALSAAYTMVKSTAAQHSGSSGLGDAIPGASVMTKD